MYSALYLLIRNRLYSHLLVSFHYKTVIVYHRYINDRPFFIFSSVTIWKSLFLFENLGSFPSSCKFFICFFNAIFILHKKPPFVVIDVYNWWHHELPLFCHIHYRNVIICGVILGSFVGRFPSTVMWLLNNVIKSNAPPGFS